MAHARAKLTPLGRALLVQRVVVMGWAPARAAETAGVSRPTVYKWVRRFTEEGVDGLLDRTSAPHRHPKALPVREVRRILRARRDLGWGPHRLGPWLGHPRSTVYGVLRREKVPRLGELDRPTKTPIRYERDRPGELIHVDVKKLGRASGEGPVLIGDLGGCLGRLLACRALLDLLGRGARWRRRAPASEVRLSVRAAERARVNTVVSRGRISPIGPRRTASARSSRLVGSAFTITSRVRAPVGKILSRRTGDRSPWVAVRSAARHRFAGSHPMCCNGDVHQRGRASCTRE